MAYITNYTYSQLCQRVEISIEIGLDIFFNHIYPDKDLYVIFNDFERKFLFNYSTILKDEESFLMKYYKFVPKYKDSKTFIMEKNKSLKYHEDYECKYLKKKFFGILIPKDLKSKGNEAIDDLRKWFLAKGFQQDYHNGVLDISKVTFAYNMKFPKKYGTKPLNEGYSLVVEKPNSGSIQVAQSFDSEQFESEILQLKEKYFSIFKGYELSAMYHLDYLSMKSDNEFISVISNEMNSEFSVGNARHLKSKFLQARKIKIQIIKLLLEYFKWTYKITEKNFHKPSLDSFGVSVCSNCDSRNVSAVF